MCRVPGSGAGPPGSGVAGQPYRRKASPAGRRYTKQHENKAEFSLACAKTRLLLQASWGSRGKVNLSVSPALIRSCPKAELANTIPTPSFICFSLSYFLFGSVCCPTARGGNPVRGCFRDRAASSLGTANGRGCPSGQEGEMCTRSQDTLAVLGHSRSSFEHVGAAAVQHSRYCT